MAFHPIRLFAIVLGLLAMLSCLHPPASAEPLGRHSDLIHVHVRQASGAPCCPDAGTSSHKTCGQQCATIAGTLFAFAHLPQVSRLRFDQARMTASGISYDPLVPPPR